MKNFLGFLPLKIGVNLLVSIHLTQASNSYLVNVTELSIEFPYPWLFCMFCNLYAILVWVIVFYGTHKESTRLIRLALNMWIIFTIIWFISVIFSVTDNLERYVCVCQRCSESMWFFNNDWHVCLENNKYLNYISGSNQSHLKTFGYLIKYNTVQSLKNKNKISKNGFGYVTICIAILLIYFIFGIITLSSYLKELKCKENQGKLELKSIVSTTALQDNQNDTKVFKTSGHICKELKT